MHLLRWGCLTMAAMRHGQRRMWRSGMRPRLCRQLTQRTLVLSSESHRQSDHHPEAWEQHTLKSIASCIQPAHLGALLGKCRM